MANTQSTGLPTPRLQLRWALPTEQDKAADHCGCDWVCIYELILPLRDLDIRRATHGTEQALQIGRTFVGTSRKVMHEAPFRDGAHARWDSEALGGFPVYVIGSDGSAHLQQNKSEAA